MSIDIVEIARISINIFLMSSYFPLLPNLSSNKFDILVKSSLSLANYPNNILKENHISKNNENKAIFYYVYYLENNVWKKYSKIKCEYGELVEIKRSEINISNNSSIVVIPSKIESLPSETRILPTPINLKKDNSFVADRCSFNFFIDNYVSSFQGEYPFNLATAKKGSFFSFDSLNLGQENIDCYLFLLNINTDARTNESDEICFYDPEENNLIKKIKVFKNTYNIINMNNINLLKESIDKLTFITSDSTTFIPIFLNIKKNESEFQLSVEHTHPPTELFWGKEKLKAAIRLKKNWIY